MVPVEAYSITGSATFTPVSFKNGYSTAPVVLTSVVTLNDPTTVTTQLRNISQTSFQVQMRGEEANTQTHGPETIHYVVWSPASNVTYDGLTIEAKRTGQDITNKPTTITFATPFMNMPIFLAAMQTTADTDPAVVRWDHLSFVGVDVELQEETSKNRNVNHSAEIVGYIAFAPAP